VRRLWRRFRRARRTLRFRTTAAAAVVVWIVLTIGAGAVVGFQQQLLEADVDLLLADDLDAVSAALFSGASPAEALDEADPTAGIVIDDGSTQVERQPRIDRGDRHGSRRDPDDIRRLTRTIRIDDRDVVLIASRDTSTVEDATGRSVRGAFAIVPVVTAFVAAVVWLAVGRALRPVEAMRADAAAIVGSRDGQRLGSPGTGDEIDRLAQTLNSMLDRLSASDERQRRLLADAAHELRSPLAGLRARIETGDLDTATALGEIRRLQDLVDSLLLLSALRCGPTQTERHAGRPRRGGRRGAARPGPHAGGHDRFVRCHPVSGARRSGSVGPHRAQPARQRGAPCSLHRADHHCR
jgi:hypothetical protein